MNMDKSLDAHASEYTSLLTPTKPIFGKESTSLGSLSFDGSTDLEVRLIIYCLFTVSHYHHQHPKTIPTLCPEQRGKRHRHPALRNANHFRHWWKTSRLLVRLTGSYEFCHSALNWTTMAKLDVTMRKQGKMALRQVKAIGRGGPNRDFLQNMHIFTRTLRIVIATFRALEARVDNRFLEVGLAEFMAFFGNQCFRYYARNVTDITAKYVMLPISGKFLAPMLDQQSRPVIVFMGLMRAILPFVSSFYGASFGRRLTYNTVSAFHYRWRPIQSIFHFHSKCGVYQDIDPDPFLFQVARQVAVAIGNGNDHVHVRTNLMAIGFSSMFAAGSGGYTVYRYAFHRIILHVTPYGPSVLDQMPRYVILERRPSVRSDLNPIMNAALPSDAILSGFTYSGAFFTSQEWAALQQRFEDEMNSYRNACMIMGTNRAHIRSTTIEHNELAFPPTDLLSLKAFIRTGQSFWKQRHADKNWNQVLRAVQKMTEVVEQHQSKGTAPKGVILYMEGLDCSGKSSTGGLIQNALEGSGYRVEMRQYNRPPTAEQKRMPWMSRFERPVVQDQDEYSAMVWDRGPGGDFVYGNLGKLPVEEKVQRFAEFRAFDRDCQKNNILFFKLLFVTDKDSIAATLGKRLAHKKIAQDLRTWLDGTSHQGHPIHEGLAAIEAHVDPTDFVAFNEYSENLENFCDVARNTDQNGYDNPWFVVSTSNRHAARLSLMKAFSSQLRKHSKHNFKAETGFDDIEVTPVPKDIVEAREHGISKRAVLQTFLLLCLVFAYSYQTWQFVRIDFD
ncbi:hypothetical protein MHU86_1818 [Fragilaria crotonensis]|nr:hypothetical protein MHU86_1818 [Fragilaria crotonensis]